MTAGARYRSHRNDGVRSKDLEMNRKLFAISLFVAYAVPCAGQERALRPAEQPVLQPAAPATQSASQSTGHKPRLRIGVALEGGGALGLAHIGVLQWFEQHHIPIDYIAGTSMGSLVAGLYATGQSPAELKAIVEKQNWNAIIDGQTSYRDLSFRRKEDARAFPNRLEFGLKH